MEESSFWRPVSPDEERVPKRAPLAVVESTPQPEAPDAKALARVEGREEELWLVSSDSKFHARWFLNGATPENKAKEGVVLVPGRDMTMDSPLIVAIADRLQGVGIPTIRFDYRGVGKSPGKFDAVAAVRDLVSATTVLCGANGTSGPCETSAIVACDFGSASAIGNIYTKGVRKFVSISHGLGLGSTRPDGTERDPVQDVPKLRKLYNRTNIFFTTMRLTIPKLWIVGSKDDLTPRDELEAWLAHYSPGKGDLSTIHTIHGANHALSNFENHAADLILAWLPSATPITFHFDFKSGPVDHVYD